MRWLAFGALATCCLMAGCARSLEDRIVGVWTAQPKESKVPPLPIPGMQRQVDQFIGTFVLKLRSDKTFVLNSQMNVEGTWSLEGNTLHFKASKDKLPNALGDSVKELSGKLSEDRSRIILEQPSPLGSITLVLKKTA